MATKSEVAAEFGYTLAFFNSNAELKKLLDKATGNNYSSARFVAELQNTQWFRHASESTRKYVALKASDPATFTSQKNSTATHIVSLGNKMGAVLSGKNAQDLADKAMRFGWTDEQLTQVLGNYLHQGNGNQYRGGAAALQGEYQKMASDLGISLGNGWMFGAIKKTVTGYADQNSIEEEMRKIAASKYVALKDRIMGGETVRQIADPYIQSYAKLLEVNGDNINIDDPLIQRALQAKDAKGKPTTQSVYDFEQTLRNDPRWTKTKNAQDVMSSAANSILQTFGFGG